jgi:DNA-binding transcriptional MerR regulator
MPPMKLRIDELASRAGTTSRNVRAYQARGLLPPPQLEGRTGFYGQEHLDRLRIIHELQERGFSLAAISELLKTWAQGGDLGHLLGFRHLLAAPLTDEEPTRYELAELTERFPEAAGAPQLLERAVALDLVRPEEDGSYVAPSPLLIEAGEELIRAGVPLPDILELVAELRGDIARIADRFAALVAEHITPSVADHPTEDDLEHTLESIRRLRPIALEVVRPLMAQELHNAALRAFERLAQELDEVAQGHEAS